MADIFVEVGLVGNKSVLQVSCNPSLVRDGHYRVHTKLPKHRQIRDRHVTHTQALYTLTNAHHKKHAQITYIHARRHTLTVFR